MQKLYTAAGRALPDIPWDRYPRPQLVRQDWLCLNGDWGLSLAGQREPIRVPSVRKACSPGWRRRRAPAQSSAIAAALSCRRAGGAAGCCCTSAR